MIENSRICYDCDTDLNEFSESKGHIGQCRYCYALYKRHQRLDSLAGLKHLARAIAGKALRKGLIFKHPCSCGSKLSQMHHPDYSKPLDVIWYCKGCHEDFHTMERKALAA